MRTKAERYQARREFREMRRAQWDAFIAQRKREYWEWKSEQMRLDAESGYVVKQTAEQMRQPWTFGKRYAKPIETSSKPTENQSQNAIE